MTTATRDRLEAPADRPARSPSFDLIVGLAAAIGAAGYVVDAWSHGHLLISSETYFTPTHAALYGGFTLIGVLLAAFAARNRRRGYAWRTSLPAAYDLSVVGLLIMLFGALPDYLWHLLYGPEESLDILFSPTHIFLALGTVLVILGPLRSALSASPRPNSLPSQLPALLSLCALMFLIVFFTQYVFDPGVQRAMTPVGMQRFGSDFEATAFTYYRQSLAVLIIFLHATLFAGVAIYVRRNFAPRFGALTLLFGVSWAAVSALVLNDVASWTASTGAAVLTGLVGDGIGALGRRGERHAALLRWFAFAVPATYTAAYLALVAIVLGGTWFDRNVIIGIVLFSGVIGLFLSYLAVDGRAPARA